MFTAKYGKMKAFSVEQNIMDGEKQLKELFKQILIHFELASLSSTMSKNMHWIQLSAEAAKFNLESVSGTIRTY